MSPRAGPSRLTSSALVSPGRGLVEELAEKLHQLLLLGGRQSTVDVVAAEGRHGDEVLAEEVVSDGGAGRTRLGFFAEPAISVSPITSIPSPSRQSIPLRRDPARPTWRSSRPNRRAPSELRSARGRKTPSRPGPRRQGRQRRCAESRTPGRTADRVLISSSSMSELP